MSQTKESTDIDLLTQSSQIDNVMKIVDPYTIFVINNSVKNKISYKQLSDEYPSLKDIILHEKKLNINHSLLHSNHRCQITISSKEQISEIFSPIWKMFLEYHLSNVFIDNIINKLNLNVYDTSNITMEISIGYNLPVCYEYIPYTEDLTKDTICQGWFFIRNDNDNSKGGHLELNYNKFNEKNEFITSKITTIQYQKNCFIILHNQIKDKYGLINFSFTKRQISINTHRYLTFKLKLKPT
jgi:hypothetical protein